MGAFVRGQRGQYSRKVKFGVPEGTGTKYHDMIITFNEQSQEYLTTITETTERESDLPRKDKSLTYEDICRDIVAGWQPNGKVFEEQDKSPVEYSPENLEAFLVFPMVAQTIVMAFVESMTDRTKPSGNSKGQRSGG